MNRRLQIKRFGHDKQGSCSCCTATYSHSKTTISSVGAMIGSYNLTGAARTRHMEHSVLLGPETNMEGLRNECDNCGRHQDRRDTNLSRKTLSPLKMLNLVKCSIHTKQKT